jgi:hypothetical protein
MRAVSWGKGDLGRKNVCLASYFDKPFRTERTLGGLPGYANPEPFLVNAGPEGRLLLWARQTSVVEKDFRERG